MYHRVLLTALSVYAWYTTAVRPQNGIGSSSQALLSYHDRYVFRDAVREDIDDIVTVILDAFSTGCAWQYVRPEYQRFKDYTWHCLRAALTREWDDMDITNTTFVKVVAIPVAKASDGRNERVVALGTWKLMTRGHPAMHALEALTQLFPSGITTAESQVNIGNSDTQYNCSANLDVNQTRAIDFDRQLRAAKSQYIDRAYLKQLYLNILATHPDWDGYGFAALNLDWGIGFAKTLAEPVTLMATPAGYPLYHDVGFRSLKNVTIETLEGWEGKLLWLEVMEYS